MQGGLRRPDLLALLGGPVRDRVRTGVLDGQELQRARAVSREGRDVQVSRSGRRQERGRREARPEGGRER
eukprot:15930737-Heterocapsa_arctica.AAC.1